MEKSEYAVAGWFAIAAAIVTLPMLALGIAVEIVARTAFDLAPLMLMIYSAVVIAHTVFSLYAFLRFRSLLNQRHGFHDVDGLMTAIIVGAIVLGLFMIPAKAIAVLADPSRAMIFMLVAVMLGFAVIMSVLSVIFAIRLLRLQSSLNGYLRPYVFITIGAAACFALFITAPLGLILDATGNVVLGLILLKPKDEEAVPEFV